jgi:hypothetical protein
LFIQFKPNSLHSEEGGRFIVMTLCFNEDLEVSGVSNDCVIGESVCVNNTCPDDIEEE